MLKELLPKSHMQQREKVDSWEDAIKIASIPLLKEGIIEESYIENMIESVNKNGPYIVLIDYFALPHAKAGEGVNRLGMSLLTLNHPVDLKGNPVKVFLVLAAVDATSHIEALADISKLLMDPKNYEIFMSGDLDKINDIL
ncbi:PTS sugar transporter subunit IIA [Caldifermentibacillus hisashii]|uniref:PTS sugar transporter subunit IIA n=1 Tax=Caldifermentibacillus hisashii TaxID=996558 RepID=UPI0022B99412|nr:PTS sugar transporter subunit IIA [Caldifermentibacillus hisashii]